jgi:hypothetical protein
MRFWAGVTTVAFATLLVCSKTSSRAADAKPPITAATPSDTELVAKIDDLISALSSFKSTDFQKIDGAAGKSGQLTSRLYELSTGLADRADGAKVSSITKSAGDLSAAIGGLAAPVKSLIQQNDDASQALNKLLASIQDLGLRKPGLVVKIIEAKFGDTFSARSLNSERWCDATAYMRAHCDRTGSCLLDANYQDVVCGFNPAPSADPRDRGLYVDYQCVPNIEASFAWAYDPVARQETSPILRKKNRSDYVILRGGGAIVCGVAAK